MEGRPSQDQRVGAGEQCDRAECDRASHTVRAVYALRKLYELGTRVVRASRTVQGAVPELPHPIVGASIAPSSCSMYAKSNAKKPFVTTGFRDDAQKEPVGCLRLFV